jgi:hypothetical protein
MPLNMTLSPERDRLVVMLNGWREQGLQVVDLDLSAGVQISTPKAVFSEAVVAAIPSLGYDIDSGGKRVIVPVTPSSSTSRSIVIVQNWYEAFRDQPR